MRARHSPALAIAAAVTLCGCARAERDDAGDPADVPLLAAQTTTSDGHTLLKLTVSSAAPEDLVVVSLDSKTTTEMAARPSFPGETELSGLVLVRAVGSDRELILSWVAASSPISDCPQRRRRSHRR